MAYANIELQNQTIQIQTVPGSGLIQVFLSETSHCFYNPASGLFSAAPVTEGRTPDLVTHHLPELKQKLDAFDANRRAEIARLQRLSTGV